MGVLWKKNYPPVRGFYPWHLMRQLSQIASAHQAGYRYEAKARCLPEQCTLSQSKSVKSSHFGPFMRSPMEIIV